jgi:hypothetical protein
MVSPPWENGFMALNGSGGFGRGTSRILKSETGDRPEKKNEGGIVFLMSTSKSGNSSQAASATAATTADKVASVFVRP